MKRALLLLLILIYTTAVSGASFHLHFCGTHLQMVTFGDNEHKGCCCKKDMPRKAGNCCTDKTVTLKADDEHSGGIAEMPALCCKCIPSVQWSNAQYLSISRHAVISFAHSPPPLLPVCTGSSKLILNSTFRI